MTPPHGNVWTSFSNLCNAKKEAELSEGMMGTLLQDFDSTQEALLHSFSLVQLGLRDSSYIGLFILALFLSIVIFIYFDIFLVSYRL